MVNMRHYSVFARALSYQIMRQGGGGQPFECASQLLNYRMMYLHVSLYSAVSLILIMHFPCYRGRNCSTASFATGKSVGIFRNDENYQEKK